MKNVAPLKITTEWIANPFDAEPQEVEHRPFIAVAEAIVPWTSTVMGNSGTSVVSCMKFGSGDIEVSIDGYPVKVHADVERALHDAVKAREAQEDVRDLSKARNAADLAYMTSSASARMAHHVASLTAELAAIALLPAT